MNGEKIEEKEQAITFHVSTETKADWEAILKAFAERGYEMDEDEGMKRIIWGLEVGLAEREALR